MRFPHDGGYTARLGAAVYAFAYVEWLLIEVTRLLEPSHPIESLTGGTSGARAEKLKAALEAASLPAAVDQGIGQRFADLVVQRNDILHSHPATDPDGRQRLYRWSPRRGRVGFISDDTLDALIVAAEALNHDANGLRTYLQSGQD